jgi:hypothetical protein
MDRALGLGKQCAEILHRLSQLHFQVVQMNAIFAEDACGTRRDKHGAIERRMCNNGGTRETGRLGAVYRGISEGGNLPGIFHGNARLSERQTVDGERVIVVSHGRRGRQMRRKFPRMAEPFIKGVESSGVEDHITVTLGVQLLMNIGESIPEPYGMLVP